MPWIFWVVLFLVAYSTESSAETYAVKDLTSSYYPAGPKLTPEEVSAPQKYWNTDWNQRLWVNMQVPDSQSKEITVKNCSGLEAAINRGADTTDEVWEGREYIAREHCSKIHWMMTIKPAAHSGIKYPIVIDKDFFKVLVDALQIKAGYAGITEIDSSKGGRDDSAQSVISYDHLIAGPSEVSDGISKLEINLDFWMQGDFDGDGWLDVIARVITRYVYSPGAVAAFGPTDDENGLVMISNINGQLKISRFNDYFDKAAGK